METKKLEIAYQEFSSMEELPIEDRELSLAAIGAIKGAYAPYSNFCVGAAVRLDDGTVVTGANQENAAFPSGLCAERTAMFSAGAAYPDKTMVSIAIAGGLNGMLDKNPTSPCGACRQVMAQYQTKSGKDMSIILVGDGKILKFNRVDDILPLIFDNI
ncbi:MAG: cytidine deaminase [Bacteroidales bacterium]|nr:cytidine deaminase [Bacteroidales bacterium]